MNHAHHDDDHHHHHSANHGDSRRVGFALVLTGLFMLVEVVGGVLSGSLALLADAGHMLTDTIALALAWTAFHASDKPADSKRSYGYHRFQILAAFVNGLSLLMITGWIFVEAVQRLYSPTHVIGTQMMVVAACGLVVNVVVFLILSGGSRENLNIRGALLHVAGDLLGSIATVVAAAVIIWKGWMPIDPLLSFFVALLILRSAWSLLKRSAHILLEGTPEWLDVGAMRDDLVASVDLVDSVHHVHVWGLTQERLMLTMHVTLRETPANLTPVVREIKTKLQESYGIAHSTIEIETGDCADE